MAFACGLVSWQVEMRSGQDRRADQGTGCKNRQAGGEQRLQQRMDSGLGKRKLVGRGYS
jgi:hypothetical protein